MKRFLPASKPLSDEEWAALNSAVRRVGNSTTARRFIETTPTLGAGVQTIEENALVGITEGRTSILGSEDSAFLSRSKKGRIIPILFKDFVLHWRDLAQARLTGEGIPMAKAYAAAATCARTEEYTVLHGDSSLGLEGLMNVCGRSVRAGLRWERPGEAFANFIEMTELLIRNGHNGPFAAVVHPLVYNAMHRVTGNSSLLEIAHVQEILTGGIFQSAMLQPYSGVLVSTGRSNLELVVAVDTSIAFLGARQMNLPFRVFKAVYLRILRSDAICTF